jgi:hypothetical protein
VIGCASGPKRSEAEKLGWNDRDVNAHRTTVDDWVFGVLSSNWQFD